MKNNKRNKILKKFFNNKSLFLLSFFVLFAFLTIFAQFLSGFILPTSSQIQRDLNTPNSKLYFISLAKSQLENSATTLAKDYQKLGAGGYVWKYNGYYHVISSCYEKENDAKLVQSNIKVNYDLDSEIFIVDYPSLFISGDFDGESKKVLSKALKSFYTTYQSLFDIAVSLDTNVYNDISARLAVNSVHANFNTICADFDTLFLNKKDTAIECLFQHLKQGNSILQTLCSGKIISTGQTYSSLIKYRYTQFLECYKNFLNSF